MKTCKYCGLKIEFRYNRGWFDDQDLRACKKNTEMMLKEHLPNREGA